VNFTIGRGRHWWSRFYYGEPKPFSFLTSLPEYRYFYFMYQATINNHTFEIEFQSASVLVNGAPVETDITSLGDGHFHILSAGKSYRAEFIKADKESKVVTVKINGITHRVAVKDKFDQLLEKMGMAQGAGSRINSIKAPMPGLIIDLKIKTGDIVKPGDPLLILEAMKMENILKSPGEGTIKNVKVKKGDNVEKGQVLIEF
jgi:biotin carboxyl carrier protein